jgi:CRISPR-associated protein Cas1
MLNEFVYCPRLFYYEYVEGVFVDNADTTRGAALHARVDKGSGALPVANAPAAESEDGEGTSFRSPKPSLKRFIPAR